MPKILRVQAAQDEKEERWVRKLAGSRHGPADWILHARMVVRSWDGERVEAIAQELKCSALTVRRRLHRFDIEGIEGLGDRAKTGRPRRLTVEDDSKLIALVRQPPPGRLVTQRDGTMVARDEQGEAQWSLSALARAAHAAGISVERSQVRRILRREACAGATPTAGAPHATRISSQKNGGRQPLQRATRGLDDRLHR